ncbi:branched-chain amino acid ABC transporter permease [Demequina sp.]|uniref:branched-chain amino acid ABC transporter permease n=1 Tax=Demequina sp. TaxID=2050685 RepID=UPI0025B89C4B|nr:branched-chain amino acid ABC transporter permease [Demequina sp.]
MKRSLGTRAMVRALVVFLVAAAAVTWLLSAQSTAATSQSASLTSIVTTDTANHAPALGSAAIADSIAVTEVATPEQTAESDAQSRVLQNVFNGVVFGLLLALASVGLSLIYGTTGLSNFAHGEQVSLGAMVAYFFATDQPVSIPLTPWEFVIGWPLWWAAIAAIVIAGGTGWIQDKFLWGKLRKRGVGVVQQMIVSIGLSLALLNFLQWWIGPDRLRLSKAIEVRHQVGPIQIGNITLMSIAIATVVLISVALFLQRTRLGRATRAVSDNPSLAAASGIKVDSIIRLVWIMAVSLAALGGILMALYDSGTKFDVGAKLLLLMFAAVTLGGLGQPYGALAGSLVIGVVVETSTLWLGPDLKYATALGILIIVLLVRPQGILGRAERVG